MTGEIIDKVYQGAVGFNIILDTEKTLADSATLKIRVIKPDGTVVWWAGEQFSPRSQYILYITQTGDLADYGNYILQAYYEYNGEIKPGNSVILTVYPLGG
jgi:hypothetical protein